MKNYMFRAAGAYYSVKAESEEEVYDIARSYFIRGGIDMMGTIVESHARILNTIPDKRKKK